MRVELALPERRAARRAFDKAAAGFATADAIYAEIRDRLLARLDWLKLAPGTVADVGCGSGHGARALSARFPSARIVGIDSSVPMLELARREPERSGARAPPSFVAGDAMRLPLRDASVDLMLAGMVLPWCLPDVFFAEAARVLKEGGLLLFSTLGPDSLLELRTAWASVDDAVHVHAAFDMHDLGDLALRAGLDDAVLDVDRVALSYADLDAAIAELRAAGAVNVAAGRRRSLTGLRRWQSFAARAHAAESAERFSLTLEIVLGQAWGRGVGASGPAADTAEFGVPIEKIGRRPKF